MIDGLICGELCPSLDMLVHSVVTAYHVKRKRKAMEKPEQ